MNRKPSCKTQSIFGPPGTFFSRAFYLRTETVIQLSFILLILLILSSCTTLPQTAQNLSGKNSNSESLLLTFYSGPLNHLNGVRRGQCPMYPSCSRYCKESLEKHGFFIGWMMTCDRLMRCGRDELKLSSKINIDGKIKCYDPVNQNDRLWYNGKADIKKHPLPNREGAPQH